MSSRGLPVIAAKTLPHVTKPGLSAFCSPHDLIAIPTDGNDLVVYRLNGQIAFTVKNKSTSEAELTAVQWSPDGASLALAWSDGHYGVHSGENGRLLSAGKVRQKVGGAQKAWRLDLMPDLPDEEDEEDGAVVTHLGWERHTIPDLQQSQTTQHITEQQATTDGWFELGTNSTIDSEGIGDQSKRSVADLPRAITLLDPTEVLPRLSAIPPHGLPLVKAGTDGSKFSSQAATDAIFQAHNGAESQSVDILLVNGSDGKTLVLMDESVSVGTLNLGAECFLHASHNRSSSHALLCETSKGGFQLAFISLPLTTLGSPLLHIITTNTKRIQNLLAYITHTIRCCQHDYTSGLAFPARLINNIVTELEEKNEGDLVSNLLHLAMTGDFTTTMLEWLTDIVKEPNHKRWHAAIDTMYSHLQNHIFMHLLLALDRLTIAVTTLRGYAVSHEGSTAFDVSPQLFTNILSGIDAMRVVAQKLQLVIMTEMRQFRAFSKWLQVMIEVGSAGPFSKSAAETEEREYSNLDYPLMLAYIQNTLMRSSVEQYVILPIDLKGSCNKETWFSHPIMTEVSYKGVVDAIKRKDGMANGVNPQSQASSDNDALLNVSVLAVHLNGHVAACLERITNWQSAMLKSPSSIDLPYGSNLDIRFLDMKLVLDAKQQSCTAVIVALSREEPDNVEILHVGKTSRSISSRYEVVLPQDESSLLDAKLLDDRTLLALFVDFHGASQLVQMSWQHSSPSPPRPLSSDIVVLHEFGSESSFRPSKIQLGRRKGKEVCVVYASDGKGWIILDISANTRAMQANGGGDKSIVIEDSMETS